MKKILFLFLFLALCFTPAFSALVTLPDGIGYVNDFAGVMDSQQEAELEIMCGNFETKTTAELAICTVQSVEPLDSKTYAHELFNKWGVGKKGKDNGVLILLAMKERRIEIEVGYGLEGVLNDAKCGRILDDNAIPSFKEGNWGEGIAKTAQAISDVVIASTNEAQTSSSETKISSQSLLIGLSIFAVFVLLIFIIAAFVEGKF